MFGSLTKGRLIFLVYELDRVIIHALDAGEGFDPHAHVADHLTALLLGFFDDDARAHDGRARVADQADESLHGGAHREEVVDDQHLILGL